MRVLDREKVLRLLKDRREFLFNVYEQNKNSIAASKHLEALETTEEIYWMIADMPDAESKPGKWQVAYVEDGKTMWECSNCKGHGSAWPGELPPPFEYCPNCGAHMELVWDD